MFEPHAPILDAPVNNIIIDQLFVLLVRNVVLFNSANGQLSPQHFNQPGESPYQAIWCATQDYYKKHHKLPNRPVLEAEAVRLLSDSGAYSEQAEAGLINLLQWIFDENENPESAFDIAHGQEWLKQVLMDRYVGAGLRDLVPGRVAHIPEIIVKSNERLRQVQSISSTPAIDTIPDDWGIADPAGPPFEFDIPFLDNYMHTMPGDVNVLLGGMGGGKTMLSTQMITNAGRVQWRKETRGGEGKICAYFGFEGEARDPRIRVLSHAAKIWKSRLENMRSYSELSTAGKLAEYERQYHKYIFGNGPAIGEQERIAAEREWLNKYVRLYDFAGNRGPDGTVHGFGGVSEMRQVLDNEAHRSKRNIGLVVIDWAGMALRRYIEATGRSVERTLVHELTTFVDKVHMEIAQPFNCVVFIAHQLRGVVNRMSPAYIPSHADAEFCTMFATNAWFALTLGAKDENTNTLTLSYTKTRRGEGRKGIVLLLNGDFAHFEDASNKFKLDKAAKGIVNLELDDAPEYQKYDSINTEDEDMLTSSVDNFG